MIREKSLIIGFPRKKTKGMMKIGKPFFRKRIINTTNNTARKMAQLATIGRDTGFLARQQAVERLRHQIARLELEQEHARQELSGAASSFVPAPLPLSWLAGLGLAGFVAITMGDSGIFWGLLLWGAAIALGVHRYRRNQNARREHEHQMAVVRSSLEPRIAALRAEIEACQRDLARVEADLDHMAHEF